MQKIEIIETLQLLRRASGSLGSAWPGRHAASASRLHSSACIRASNDTKFGWACLQAFVKARGDGLGFDLIKAEFHFDDGVSSNTASVWVDGVKQTRWAAGLPTHVTYAG